MKTPLKIAAIVLIVGAAALFLIKNRGALDPAATAIDAIQTYWLCNNPECKNEFTMTNGEMSRLVKTATDEFLDCPKCGKHTGESARVCPFCNRLSLPDPRGKFPAVCPKCGKRNRVDTHRDDVKDPHGAAEEPK